MAQGRKEPKKEKQKVADLLIYRGPHWMDALTLRGVQERTAANPSFALKYKSRYQRGDVVQVYRDGACREPSSAKSKLCIVRCPDMPLRDAAELVRSRNDETDPARPVMLLRRAERVALDMIARDPVNDDALLPVERSVLDSLRVVKAVPVVEDIG